MATPSEIRALRAKRECAHPRILLFGSEETGLREAKCRVCGALLTRRAVGGDWIYSTRRIAS